VRQRAVSQQVVGAAMGLWRASGRGLALRHRASIRPAAGATSAAVLRRGRCSNQQAPRAFVQTMVCAREKAIGGSGAHLNPLGLFLCTTIPFIWRILSAFRPT
jgi:hypothetical protein